MTKKFSNYIILCSLILLLIKGVKAQQKRNTTFIPDKAFADPDRPARPWAFFWWFNGYVDKPSITKHLEEFKDKGLGGFILYACESGTIPMGAEFMSNEWRELFKFTVREANRLELEMGVNICYGWPAGGKWITPENNAMILLTSDMRVEGPRRLDTVLAEPKGKNEMYKDVRVLAMPASQPTSMDRVKLSASCNQEQVNNLLDGNYYTQWRGQGPSGSQLTEETPQWLQFEFEQPEAVDYLWVGGTAFYAPGLMDLQSSDDGIHFKTVTNLQGDYLNQFSSPVPLTKGKYFRIVFKSGSMSREYVDIGEIAIGRKPQVYRAMQMAAKLARNNPIGVTTTRAQEQLDITWKDLTPLAGEKPVATDSVIDITDYYKAGKLTWKVPPGNWKIIRIGETDTKLTAGGGLLVDFMNAKASKQHFDRFMKLLIADAGPLAGTTFKYFHEDNIEIGGPYHWTADFIEQFKKFRGYDLQPYLPALAGEIVHSTEITDRFLHDYRRTIADLVANKHFGDLADSARKYGMGMQAEAGGAYLPFILNHDGLMNLGKMDIPVAEFWESSNWKENQNHHSDPMDKKWIEQAQNVDGKQASSAGHIYGKKIVASEAFTSLGPNAHWGAAPADLLLHANVAFCEGINRLILHSSTTTKEKDGKPGYEYGAGTHFNQNVTWWKDTGPYFKFISRCEEMLQRGLFVADVLYYNGDEIPNIVTAKRVKADLGKGYDYDVCNTEVLLTRISVKNGRLTLPDGMSYGLLVLPNTRSYSLMALKKIKQLVQEGATVIGPKPERAIGLEGYPQSDTAIKALADELWGSDDGSLNTPHVLSRGKVYGATTAREVLAKNRLPQDFNYKAVGDSALIDFIHRREGDVDIYYVANRQTDTVDMECSFRVSGKQPELWNPVTGKAIKVTTYKQANGTTTIPLKLYPYGSMFVVFREGTLEKPKNISMGSLLDFKPLETITGSYQVAFDTSWGGPKSIIFDGLQDWSTHANDSIRYFSGTARYTKSFTFNKQVIKSKGGMLAIDLGDVQNTAHVWLNGKDLGILWAPPYRLDVSDAILEGENELVVEVTNLWINRLIGDSKLPVSQRRTKTNIHTAPNTALRPSGLMGPMKIGWATPF